MTIATMTAIAAVEAARNNLIAMVNKACDDLAAQFGSASAVGGIVFKTPAIQDGHDPRNKNGLNLTPRGAEILYRVFDDGGGYNRAAKMLNITQAAAKNRKALWRKAGGAGRQKAVLDIDTNS